MFTNFEIMDDINASIGFHMQDVKFNLPNRKILKSFIKQLFKQENKELDSLTYVFCTDEFLLEMNRQHLNHDYYTDIITFDLFHPGGGTIGEIYISIDRVKENAKTHKCPFQQELHRVIFHGVLHLAGFKDKTPAQQKEMRSKEDFYLSKYFDAQ